MENTTIYAFLEPLASIPENYAIKLIKEPVQFEQEYMPWAVYTRKESDPVRIKIKEQVNQYNNIVQALLDTPTFIEYFAKHELIVSKEQLERDFSTDLANLVFSMDDYEFIHQLNIKGDLLFDRLRIDYNYNINHPKNSFVFENRSEDLRDATFTLCLQLEKDGLMPEEIQYTDEDYIDNKYGWFECYDQARDDLEFPDGRVLNVLELLKHEGYIREYCIEIEPSQPILSSDYPMEVFLLNPDYVKDTALTEKIKKLLKVGIFGENSATIQTYALVSVADKDVDELDHLVNTAKGHYISLNDATGAGMIFNLSPEQIIKILSSFEVDAFIYGEDYVPSIPYLYKKTAENSFQSTPLETIYLMEDLESIAPSCGEFWKDLHFNDYFRECLWNNIRYNYR